MRVIPTRIHGALDYLIGVVLILVPYVLGFSGPLAWLPILLGAGLIAYSLLTDYELGIFRYIPMPVHLLLDVLGGVASIILGFAFGASTREWVTMLVIGVIEIGSGLMTQTTTSHTDARDRRSGLPARSTPISERFAGTEPHTTASRAAFSNQPTTVEQERGAIDSGATGDKIAMRDPATAPLGSDDEAGQEPDPRGLSVARRPRAQRR